MENQSKFLRSGDYDNILIEIMNEHENPFGLLTDIFKNHIDRNPEFIGLMSTAIDREQQVIVSKFLDIIKANPHYDIDNLPHYRLLTSLKNYLVELKTKDELNPQEDRTARQELNKRKGKANKGKSILSREQVVMLFFYLRENSLVAPNVENGTFSSAIEAMTGHSATQIQNILKMPGNPISLLGKSDSRVSKKDLKDLIPEIEKLLSRMKKDLNTFE